MDERDRLIKLYETELEKNKQMEQDMQSLREMTDEQILALVEKAQIFHEVLEKNWMQIAGDDMPREDVRPILSHRTTLRKDFSEIHEIEEQMASFQADLSSSKEEMKQYRAKKRTEQKKQVSRIIITISFGIMFLCAIFFHLLMLKVYQDIFIPAFLIMTFVPMIIFLYNIYFIKIDLDHFTADQQQEENLGKNIHLLENEVKEKKEILEFYDIKYKTVLEDLDEYEMDAYPYVEKIIQKLEYRENYQRAKNEYCGILEILHFKQPSAYLFFPEIFLVETEMKEFLQSVRENMKKMELYLSKTKETA